MLLFVTLKVTKRSTLGYEKEHRLQNRKKNKKARGLKLEINNLRKRRVNIVRPRNRHNTLLQNRKKICHKYQKKHKLFSLTTYQMTKRETNKRKTTLSERKPTRALRLQCQLWATPWLNTLMDIKCQRQTLKSESLLLPGVLRRIWQK